MSDSFNVKMGDRCGACGGPTAIISMDTLSPVITAVCAQCGRIGDQTAPAARRDDYVIIRRDPLSPALDGDARLTVTSGLGGYTERYEATGRRPLDGERYPDGRIATIFDPRPLGS